MKRIYKALSLILAAAFCLTLSSCVKDLDEQGLTASDGECNVAFELQGMPLQSALTRTSGDAIRNIRNLYVLFYAKGDTDADNYELAYAFTSDTNCANTVFEQGLKIIDKRDKGRTPGSEFNPNDGEWKGVAESKTQSVTTSEVQVRRGSYAVYVVANVDDFSSSAFSKADIATPGALRDYDLIWESNAADNDAMFGFFTESETNGYDVIHDTAPVIRFTANAKSIYAWVKRAVSKVTVAFDGSKLRNGVRVYIKDIAIHDIPSTCKLGKDNSPGSMEELITNGEQIVFTTGTGVTNTTRISAREPYFPGFSGLAENEEDVAKWKQNVHSETANALYFFENRQGKSSGAADGNGSWKQQTDNNGNNIPDDRDTLAHPGIDHNKGILKDTKTYGSYIEVNAYYQNDNFGAKTEGNIIYRFMLGKNTTDDFNADRNNHYKLTMCFKNNANDVDWHIDYSDKIGEYIPDQIYVSYEYNTPTMLPIRLVGKEFTNLTVTINSSNWYPDDSSIPRYTGTTNPTGLATGFLSLTYDENPRINAGEEFDAAKDAARVTSYWNNQANNTTRQYIDNGNKVTWTDLDKHGYNVGTRINSEGNKVFEANIPLFTRPLIIYKSTSWTGANPYYSATRTGQITLTGDIDGVPFTKKIKVIQVPRIENPSGIYRRHDNTEPFDVTLMERKGEGGAHTTPISYAPYKSKGLWRAVIHRSTSGSGNDVAAWFSLTAGAQKANAVNEYIEGDDGEPIKFTFTPNGVINQNQVRCGIIKVEYNDYTCTHYIFVRQGYAPMRLENDKVYWHTFNLYSGSAETNHPCEAGSFFIRGRLATAILDTNPDDKLGDTKNPLNAITTQNGTTPSTIAISTLKSYARGDFPSDNQSLSNNNTTLNPWNAGRIPTLAEWATLKNENANALINKAFGVLYGDGITTTQTNVDNVNKCRHADVNTSTGKASKGMRGSFVYNTDDGRNIFLPIGASGHGRRKINANGELQYGLNDSYWTTTLTGCEPRPLLYYLRTNEGAIYWAQSEVSGIPDSTHPKGDNGWDINYKTYDFDYMEAAGNRNSACYIRLVQDAPPQ